jgi:hypothetical protein
MWWRAIPCVCAVVALAAPARAQCVVDAEHVSGIVVVDRGDGEAIEVQIDEAPATITIPERDREALTVDVEGTLAMRGSSGREILSLAAGTYAGVMTVDDADSVAFTAARSVDAGVEVTVELGLGTARAVVLPCDAISSRLAWPIPRQRHPSRPIASNLWYARRGRLAIAAEHGGRTMIQVDGLEPGDWVDVVEEVDRWSHVQLRGVGVTLEGWVPTRALRRWTRPLPNRGTTGRGARARCGSAWDIDHVIATPGTPVMIPGTDRVWAHLEGEESVLVRITGEQAELIATSRARAGAFVDGCVRLVALGTIETRFLTRGVVSVFGLRMREVGGGPLLLESRPDDDALLRDDLHAGDVIVAVDGEPLEPEHRVLAVAHLLVGPPTVGGPALELTIQREGLTIVLASLSERDPGHSARPYRPMNALERALSAY